MIAVRIFIRWLIVGGALFTLLGTTLIVGHGMSNIYVSCITTWRETGEINNIADDAVTIVDFNWLPPRLHCIYESADGTRSITHVPLRSQVTFFLWAVPAAWLTFVALGLAVLHNHERIRWLDRSMIIVGPVVLVTSLVVARAFGLFS